MSSLVVVARFLAFALVAFALVGLTFAPAHATVLEAQGGSGGGRFDGSCPPGQYLRGVSIKAGSWIDAIAPLCAPFNAQASSFEKWKRGKRAGGTGGSPLLKDVACPADRWVAGIRYGWTRSESSYIDYVQLICFGFVSGNVPMPCAHTGHGCWSKHPNPPPKGIPLPGGGLNIIGDQPFEQSCPHEEAATGIHGRSGIYVDALGLICGPRPVPATATPSAPPPPAVEDPAAPPVEVGNATIPRANFSGTWNSVAGKDAAKFTLSLGQQGTLVKGSY